MLVNDEDEYSTSGGNGAHVPLPQREPVAKLQHCTSEVHEAPSATHVDVDMVTQCDVGGLASGGGSSWQIAVGGEAEPPQQSRLLVQSVAADRGPGGSHAARAKYARALPACSSCPGK